MSRGDCERYIRDASCGIHRAVGRQGQGAIQMCGKKKKVVVEKAPADHRVKARKREKERIRVEMARIQTMLIVCW